MTVILSRAHTRHYPQRKMIRGDLFQKPKYDPILEALGVQVPVLTSKQRIANMARANAAASKGKPKSAEWKAHRKGAKRFRKTTAGIAAKREISGILQRIRYAGEICR